MALSHVEDCLMLRKRHTPEEIVTKLRQVEVLTAQGRPVAEAIRSIGVTEVSSGTNCSTGRSSTRSRKPGSSSRAGNGMTTPFDRTRPSATCHQLPRSWCGRLRFPGELRRPHQPSPQGRQCSSCLVLGFDGAFFSPEWRDALWAKFSMGAPARRRRSVERYNIVKRV